MSPDLETLLVLQDRDQKIKALQTQKKSLPRDKKALEDKLATAKLLLDQAKQRSQHNEVERRKIQLDVEAKRTAIGRFKTQQQATRKNEEFQAFNNEIKHAEDNIRTLEDSELELMEQAELIQRTVTEAEKDYKKAEGIIREQIARLEAGAKAADDRLHELTADHSKIAGGVPGDVLDLYQRLFVKKGDAAVVPLEHEMCGGCHMKVPTQISAQVRGEHLMTQCPNCGRILYRVI